MLHWIVSEPHWTVGRGGLGWRRERPQELQVCHALDSHEGFDSPHSTICITTKNDTTMKRVITVTRSQREFLSKAFGVTKEMVSYALNFHPVKGQSELAKKIRSLAVQRGGFELVTAPASEVVHDSENVMRQHFDNGWMWEADKRSGLLQVFDEHSKEQMRIEDAHITDIEHVQQRIEAMGQATA